MSVLFQNDIRNKLSREDKHQEEVFLAIQVTVALAALGSVLLVS